MKCAPAAQIHAGPCFGMGLPQIIAVRKYFVDTMRNYVIRLLTSPDVMCKYNLINHPNNNTLRQYMYIMCGTTRNSLCPVTFKPHFPKTKIPQSRHSIFCNSPHYAIHPCCNFLFLFGLTNASKCERSLSLRMIELARQKNFPFDPSVTS